MLNDSISKKNERLLLFGHSTSSLGDLFFDYVNKIFLVTNFTNKPWLLATYQSVEHIASALFNVIGGTLADCTDGKKILIICDLLSSFLCFLCAFFVDFPSFSIFLIVVNALLALIFSFQSPCFRSIISQMIHKDDISKYNSKNSICLRIIEIGGPLIAVAISKIVGFQMALIIDGITFLVSAVGEFKLSPIAKAEKIGFNKKGIVDGFQIIVKDKLLLIQVLACLLSNFFMAGFNLLVPYTEIIYEGKVENFYAKVLVVEAVGGLVGAFLCPKIKKELRGNSVFLLVTLSLEGLSLILVPLTSQVGGYVMFFIPFFLFDLSLSVYNINYMSFVQMNVKQEFQGRVFGIMFSLNVILMPIGSYLFSSLNFTNNIFGFSFLGIGIVAVSLICVLLLILLSKKVTR